MARSAALLGLEIPGRNPFLNQVIFEEEVMTTILTPDPLRGRNPFLNQVIFEHASRQRLYSSRKERRNPFLNQVIFEAWRYGHTDIPGCVAIPS